MLDNNPHKTRQCRQRENKSKLLGKENNGLELNELKLKTTKSYQTFTNNLSQLSNKAEQQRAVITIKSTSNSNNSSSHSLGFNARAQKKHNLKSKEAIQNTDPDLMISEQIRVILEEDLQTTMVEENEYNQDTQNVENQFSENPQYTSAYIGDIFNFLRQQENTYILDQIYMTKQTDINGKMRAILFDWLVDVQRKFKLKDETLYITFALIDRYLNLALITRQQLQLVGVASLFIACKYEEIYPPDLDNIVYLTDKAYSKDEVLDMEGKILITLSFNITQPSAYCFLQRYGQLAGLDSKNIMLAQYLIELAMIEIKFILYLPSVLACSAIYLVHQMRNISDSWSTSLQSSSQFKESDLILCARELAILLRMAEKNPLQAVRRKFSSLHYLEVSLMIVELQSK